MTKIFISYRRDDSQDVCGRIADRLERRFGRRNIFKDVDAITGGESFPQRLTEALNDCDVMLVIIGNSWLTLTDATGHRRLDNPYDFVRYEIDVALRRKIMIIPVFVHGASLLSSAALPANITPLVMYPAATVRADPDFHRDVTRLADDIVARLATNQSSLLTLFPYPTLTFATFTMLVGFGITIMLYGFGSAPKADKFAQHRAFSR